MNIRSHIGITVAFLLVFVVSSFTIIYLAEPPVVENIEVCDGGSTVIIPEGSGEEGQDPVLIAFEDFDGGGIGYTTDMAFNDSANDHFNLTDGSNISNVSGPYSFQNGTNFFWAAEDTDDNGGNGNDEQVLTLNAVDISSYTDIQVCIDLAAGNEKGPNEGNYDDNDHVWVDYSIDGVSQRSLCFESALDGDSFNSSLNHDLNCDGDGVDGPQILNDAATFCYSIPNTETAGATELIIDILVYMDAGSEEVAFDNIEIFGELKPVIIAFEDFDGGGIGYTTDMAFNDSANDHFNLTDGSNISNVSGPYSFQNGTNFFWAAEDTDDNGGNGNDEQVLTLNAVDISSYTDIQVCIDLAAGNEKGPNEGNYDDNDHVWVDYSIDGVSQRSLCFESALDGDSFNSSLNHDLNCDGDGVDGPQILNDAATFCYSIPNTETAGATELIIDILVYMDAGSEEVAFDNIEIFGALESSGPTTFNFYDELPIPGMTVPLAANQLSYDPMTTAETSPDTIWVTADDGQMESAPTQVIIIVNPLPNATLVKNTAYGCGVIPIEIEAMPADEGLSGSWSGGSGSFDDATSAVTVYNPDASELNQITLLQWKVEGVCGVDSVMVPIYLVETGDPEFSYQVDTICPGNGSLFPVHVTGEDGIYSVVEGDSDSIALDPATGEVTLNQTAEGTYTIRNTITACGNMMITGVVDGPIPGGLPKAIELYAVQDISNLSDYGVGSANNGNGTDGEEFTFDQMQISEGTFIYVASDSTEFEAFFGFKPDFVSNAALINGDDAIELFCNGNVIDVFGDIDVDGSGQTWDYQDGWTYRKTNDEINLGVFIDTQWDYSGANALDNETNNATAEFPFPVGSFTTSFDGICPPVFFDDELTIGDFEGPMIVCPSDMTISLDPGDCGTTIYLMDPTAMDNCSDSIVFVQVAGPMNGDFLDKENSPYIVTYEGTEMNGNVLICSYMITVEEFETSNNTLACNGQVNLSFDQDCEVLVTADLLLEGNNYGCYEDYMVFASLNGAPVGVAVDNDFGDGQSVILDVSLLNQTVEVSVTDLETGNSCWGTVFIEDKLDPIFTECQDTTVVCGANTDAVVPDVFENCAVADFILDENEIFGTCQDTFYKQIVRTWIVVDINGNSSESCTQVTTVLKDAFEDLVFPPNYDSLEGNEDALQCDKEGIDFALDANGLPSATQVGFIPGTGEPVLGNGCAELIIYYSDDVIETCGTTYKVLRHWSVVDWCSGMTAEQTQIIKVMDVEGPSFSVPENVVVPVNTNCEGEYGLPLIAALDNCNAASVTFESNQGEISGGVFYVQDPILGSPYTIDAVGTDDCGNKTIIPFTIVFADLTAPIINAETSLTVSLSADGTAKLFAESFDDGSYDACTDVGFDIIRMVNSCQSVDYLPPAGNDNYQFNDVVHFCCSDVGEPQMVQLRVCDDADQDDTFGSSGDNCNFVMVEVQVQDKLAPILICPGPIDISCIDLQGIDLGDADLLDELFGEPSVEFACEASVTQSAVSNANCGAGVIFRTFTAANSINSVSCTQVITVSTDADNTLTCDRIQFADLNNNTYNWCSVNDNVNDNDDDLPALQIECNDGFEIPVLDIDIVGLCTEVGLDVEVDSFQFAGGACKKYLVHYEVIDQCIFDDNFVDIVTGEIDPYNSKNGYFEFYIEIDAFDNEGPIFEPEDITHIADFCDFSSIPISAEATDACTNAEYLSYLYRVDFNNDNDIDFPASGWASGSDIITGNNGLDNLPLGNHKIYWIVSDGCGNSTARSQNLTILPNDKHPTPYCKTGFVANISAMGMISISAEDFDAGSFDNCDAQEDLRFSFSPDVDDTERMYTCDELGFQFIKVYVTDLAGNQDFCSTTFLVQDNGSFCSNTLQSGSVTSSEGYTNKSADVVIEDIEQGNVHLSTDENGAYFVNPDAYSEIATMHIEDDQDILMGVTTLDIITIQKHILGIAPLESNSSIIAADVNNNGVVSGSDIIQIRKVILGYQDYFKNNHSWVAYPSEFDLDGLADPFDYPKTALVSEMQDFDWTTIKVADVNGSHQFNSESIDTRTSYELEFEIVEEHDQFIVNFYGEANELVGLDLTFQGINNENFVSISSNYLDINADNVKVDEYLRVLWSQISHEDVDGPLFSISLQEAVSKLQTGLGSQLAYLGKGVLTETSSVNLIKRNKVQEEISGDVAVYPNPFTSSVAIDLSELNEELARIVISDVSGKVVSRVLVNGGGVERIDGSIFTVPGLYTVQIKTSNKVFIKKLIKLAD